MTTLSSTTHLRDALPATADDTMAFTRGRVSWSPILMGAVTAIGLQFIFTVLGIALGATVSDTTAGVDDSAARTVGIVAGLWWLVTGTLSLAVGGFVLGRLSGLARTMPLQLEAIAMWGVVAIFGFLVLWSGAGMMSQAASPLGSISAPSWNSTDRSMGSRENMSTGTSTSSDRQRSEFSTSYAEDARRATRTASWWAVIGLLAGVGAAVAGAYAGTPDHPRGRLETL